VSGWTWLGGLFVAAIVSLLLFVTGLVLLVIKKNFGAALILSSAFVTLSFIMTFFIMDKVGWIFYSHLHNESFINKTE
jgi:hypothetical protein